MSRWTVLFGVPLFCAATLAAAQAPPRPTDPVFVRAQTLVSDGNGVAGRALIDGTSYAAAMSLGGNPTFGESELKMEAFLLDYAGDLYGRPIEIDFLARLRDIERFDSVDQLVCRRGVAHRRPAHQPVERPEADPGEDCQSSGTDQQLRR